MEEEDIDLNENHHQREEPLSALVDWILRKVYVFLTQL